MKKIFALTLVLVLAIGASAMAATTLSQSGRVRFFTDNVLGDPIVWGNDYRLNITGTVSETAGFSLRFEGDPAAVKRANYWAKTPVGKVVVGKQFDDLSGLAINYTGEYMSASFTGVGVYPTIAEGVTAFGFWNPAAKQFGAQAKVAVAAATVFGGVSKADADDDMKLSVGASYPVIPDVLTVYGQFDKFGDVDEKYVGASGVVAGIDVAGEYKVDAKEFALDFTKKIGDVEFNSTYTKPDGVEGTLSLYTTVAF